MKNLSIIILSIFLILQSCGEDKKPIKKDKDIKAESTTQLTLDNTLKFEINGDFPLSETPIIYWRTKDIGWFEEKNTVYGGTNGFSGNQTIKFEIPSNVTPADFRIDISSNPEQKEIKVNFIRIIKGGKDFYIFGEELDKYFTFNEYITYNKENKKLIFKSIDGNYDPFLNTNEEFLNIFNKVYYNY